LLAAAGGVLAACSHPAGTGTTPFIKRHAAVGSGPAASSAADPGPTDLVSAVSAGGEEGPVGLKFQVIQRPVAGKPVQITLRLLAKQPLDHLEARFHPDDGLTVTQGGDFEPEGQMEPGSAVDHALTVIPAHDGVFAVMATVTSGSDAEIVSRSFVIPIVVSPDAPPGPAKR
jgi:hypothetical protein